MGVIKDLRQRTGYDFVYQKQVLDGVPAITCNCQGMSLAELLDCVFHSLAGLDYEVSGKTIVSAIQPNAAERGIRDRICLRKGVIGSERWGDKMRQRIAGMCDIRDRARKLLAAQLDEDGLAEVVQLLAPGHADYIVGYARQLRAPPSHAPLLPGTPSAVARAVWAVIVHDLLVRHGSEFNRRRFIAATLRQLAARHNVAYRELLDRKSVV